MKAIVTLKNYHSTHEWEREPIVRLVPDDNVEAQRTLQKIWERELESVLAEAKECGDAINEDGCYCSTDYAVIQWDDGDSLEYFVVAVEE